MCGFVIAIGNFSETELKAATQSISYRGPDDTDFFFNDHAKVKIGFNRLSILDLSENGNQPMVSQNGNWVIIMNGEIYNFQELREKLGKTRADFKSQTDTEVVLAAFDAWGINRTLNFINGIYAIVLYEHNNKIINYFSTIFHEP